MNINEMVQQAVQLENRLAAMSYVSRFDERCQLREQQVRLMDYLQKTISSLPEEQRLAVDCFLGGLRDLVGRNSCLRKIG